MPKIDTIQTNFTAGELSPKLKGRVDLQRYQNAAATIENALPAVFGGVRRRFGTSLRATTKFPGTVSRLVPFIINRDKSYMLEVGDHYFRVFTRDGAPVPGFEVATPYSAAQIWTIDYVQAADQMFVAHQQVEIQQLRSFGDASWFIDTPLFTTTPFDEVGRYPMQSLVWGDTSVGTGRTVTSSGDFWLASDVGRAIISNSGIAVITAITSPTVAVTQINSRLESILLPAGTWNLDASPMTALTLGGTPDVGSTVTVLLGAPGFRPDDVGSYIRANDGLLRITSVGDELNAVCEVIATPTSVGPIPAEAWSLESALWTDLAGYPGTVSIHEQRLIAAGSPKKPQTVWGSVTGEKLNFSSGTTLDTDAFSFTVESDEVNPINYVASGRNLLALTYGGEFSLKGGVEKPITPTNVQIQPESPHGSLNVRPINVGKEIMFVQRAARKVRAMAYQYTIDGYVAPDITVLAEHITESGIKDMAYQQEPDQIIWAVRNDGVLISCTIDRDQDVIAWARHTTDGLYEAIATIPGENGDDLWTIVNRGGVRYVERFESSWIPFAGSAKDWGYFLDAAVAYDTAGETVFAGLDHLNGKSVVALGDGAVFGPFTVASGTVTLPRPAKKVLIGLPYTSTIELLRPEIQAGTGTSQNSRMRTSDVTLRFLETIGATVNGKVMDFRNFGQNLLDAPPTPYSGDQALPGDSGWDTGQSPIVITQPDPLPFHLLAVVRTFTVNQP